MNIQAPVSTIMTTKLLTVSPKDTLQEVKDIFDNNKIHHVPVVKYKNLLGIISKTDLLHFVKGFSKNNYDEIINTTRLKNYLAEDIMTTGIAKLDSDSKISTALKVFKENLFHAIPIMEDNEIVGIITTYDIIKALDETTVPS